LAVSDLRHQGGTLGKSEAYLACWPRDTAAPRTGVHTEREGDRSMVRGFKIDVYGLVPDGRGWSREERIRVVRLGCGKEVSKRELDIFEGVLVH
jgi:hypothetical protein